MSKPKPPTSLETAGKALWSGVVAKYTLRVDELAVLESACKTVDTIAALDKAWADLGKPFITTGSMQQEVIHPLIGEKRTQQAALARLLGQLKLPDDAAPGVVPNQARSAADTRWKHGA